MNNIIDKITNFIIPIMTIVSPVLFLAGAFGMDTPNTAVPEIMLIIALAWFAFVLYCCKGNNATETNK